MMMQTRGTREEKHLYKISCFLPWWGHELPRWNTPARTVAALHVNVNSLRTHINIYYLPICKHSQIFAVIFATPQAPNRPPPLLPPQARPRMNMQANRYKSRASESRPDRIQTR